MKLIIPPSIVKILSNKYISLILIIISLTTIITNLYKGNLYPLIIYFAALLILTSFNDNTTFNLLLSFIIMTIFTSNCLNDGETEGFENNQSNDNDTEADSENGFKNLKQKDKVRDRVRDRIHQDDTYISEDDNYQFGPIKTNSKKIIQFDKDKKRKNVINYASTIKDAYSNLNETIGSDGIQNLTADTENLIDKQIKLAETMKNIEPFINTVGPILDKAHGLLGNIDTKAFDNIKSFAKKFSI